MTWPITYEDVVSASRRLDPFLTPTPLRSYSTLDAALGCHVLVKHENHQPTNAFKIRNGLAALTALEPEEKKHGVVAATRGNHGLGLAYAGHMLQIPVTICVPEGNNPEKNEAIRGLGARLVEEGSDYDEAVLVMKRLVASQGLRMIHSTNEPLVIAGAGTLTQEILTQAKRLGESIDAMVVAVGGGSQSVGAMTVIQELAPQIPVYGVQAAGAPAIYESWKRRKPIVLEKADTFADGVATRMTYELTFQALLDGLADFVIVSEEEIAEAVRMMIQTTHNLAEGAGAMGLAGLIRLGQRLAGKTVAIVLSGSNIDRETLAQIYR